MRNFLFIGAMVAATVFAQDDFRSVEAEIEQVYQQALSSARKTRNAEDVEKLKDSETKWRAYRDAECRAENGGETCLVRMTKARIAALKALYLR